MIKNKNEVRKMVKHISFNCKCKLNRYLVSFVLEKDDAIYNRIRYLIGEQSVITYVFSHYYVKIKVDSYDYLAIEKKLTLHNAIIHIKSVINK